MQRAMAPLAVLFALGLAATAHAETFEGQLTPNESRVLFENTGATPIAVTVDVRIIGLATGDAVLLVRQKSPDAEKVPVCDALVQDGQTTASRSCVNAPVEAGDNVSVLCVIQGAAPDARVGCSYKVTTP